MRRSRIGWQATAVFVAALLTASSSQADTFRIVGGDLERGRFMFLNVTESPVTYGGSGTAWALLAWTPGKSDFVGSAYAYLRMNIDCSQSKTRIESAKGYDDKGRETFDMPINTDWSSITPETLSASAVRAVCRGDVASLPLVREASAQAIVAHLAQVASKAP